MKKQIKFENIKGMLQKEEMRNLVGGNAYPGASAAASNNGGGGTLLAGTTLAGGQNVFLGLTISYATGTGTSINANFNYAAGGVPSSYTSAHNSGYGRP